MANRVRGLSDGSLAVEDAALYQALHRLERKGMLDAEWGQSDNHRRCRFCALTPEGRRHLRVEAARWRRYSHAVTAALAGA